MGFDAESAPQRTLATQFAINPETPNLYAIGTKGGAVVLHQVHGTNLPSVAVPGSYRRDHQRGVRFVEVSTW